ncbi:hypothetical protein [Nocardia abscessus]|uniref:hypothetical protein n=1 Tax=Nocardia abscessus TaxID=120957 RepID=UPI001D1352F6|nr:hypothetical protein [Nocardia abscessus]MCC3326800.1 hypothetical protein [Nocardia abscessus]
MATLRIPRRFNGPPDSGNGGYVAGLLAEQRDEATATVILRSPPPLETPLDVREDRLYDRDTLIAESKSGGLERDAPHAVPFADAVAASRGYTSIEMFASCFVCGSGRADGLRIEPGRVDAARVAAPWVPDETVPLGAAPAVGRDGLPRWLVAARHAGTSRPAGLDDRHRARCAPGR